jgi:hypothetical protein
VNPTPCRSLAPLGALTTLLLWSSALASPLTTGAVCSWGASDCTKCVPDAVSAVNSLRDHGDVLGFHPIGDPVTMSSHWQGIQRIPAAGGRYVAVSHSGTTKAFTLVNMESREAWTGQRFRSNRLNYSYNYPSSTPSTLDRAVRDEWLPWYLPYTHSGGMQAAGNILAVSLENTSDGRNGQVVFYDMNNPATPVLLPPKRVGTTTAAGTASLAKLSDGTFLLILGQTDANNLEFHRSNSWDLTQPTTTFEPVDLWNEGELRSTIGDWEFGNYQNLNLITQCDGSLFLAGTHRNSVTGEDWIDLYRLTNEYGQMVITKVAKKHLYCGYPSPGGTSGQTTHCNLDAAGGVYVDPSGQLIVYGTEHDNDGPGGSVKMMEFRSIFPNPSCGSTINEAFVELYDDSDFSDRGLMIDYRDFSLERYSNLNYVEGFGDKTSAVRWCLPFGWRFRIYEHDSYGGSYKELKGSGSQNLNSWNFGDKMSSGRFIYLGY